MPKFNVTVTRTDTYIIDVDDTVWTPAEIEDWGNIFWGGLTPEDVASSLATARFCHGNEFLEGFGYVREVDSEGTKIGNIYTDNFSPLPEEEYAKGLTIYCESEDETLDVDISLINPSKSPQNSLP